MPNSPPLLSALPGGRLALSGPAGWSWQLLLGRPDHDSPGLPAGEHLIPLRDDSILALSRLEPTFSGRFTGNESITLDIPRKLLSDAGADQLVGCLLLLRDVLIEDAGTASPVAAISSAISVRR